MIEFQPTVSKSELLTIRSLDWASFERAFESQLRNERRQTLLSIYFMKEAYRRGDWAREYSSFSRYCTMRMKMSDSDFYRKYAIMKTLDELPEIEEKMIDGSLNPSTVSKAIQFLNKEARLDERVISRDEKRELFSQIENLTEKQVEREFASRSPEAPVLDQALEEKLERLRKLLAPSFQGRPTDNQLFHALADIALEKLDPVPQTKSREKRQQTRQQTRRLKKDVKDLMMPAVRPEMNPFLSR